MQEILEKIKTFWTFVASYKLLSLFVVVVGLLVLKPLLQRNWVIKPIEVPSELAQQGYTGGVIVSRLMGYLNDIREETSQKVLIQPGSNLTKAPWIGSQRQMEIQQQIDIKLDNFVPGVDISFDSLVLYVQNLLRMEPHYISGNIVVMQKAPKFLFNIWVGSKTLIRIERDDLEQVIHEAARQVLEELEPLTIGLSYCANYDVEHLSQLLRGVRKNKKEDQKTALILYGCLLENQKEYKEALRMLEKAEKIEPSTPTIFYMSGSVLQKLGEEEKDFDEYLKIYEKAKCKYQKVLELEPESAEAYTEWAMALITLSGKLKEQGLAEKALKAYKTALAKYETALDKLASKGAWIYTSRGEAFKKLHEPLEKVVEQYQKALEVDPYYALAYGLWGQTLTEQHNQSLDDETLKKDDEALKKFERAIELEKELVWIYGQWGKVLYEKGLYQEAIDKYAKAVSEYEKRVVPNPNLGWTYGNWGEALSELGQYEEANLQYEKAVKVVSVQNLGWIYSKWGNNLYKQREEQEENEEAIDKEAKEDDIKKCEEEAIDKYEKAANIDSNYSPELWGTRFIWLEKYDKADEEYLKYLKFELKSKLENIRESVAIYYYRLGEIYKHQKKFKEAIDLYSAAIQVRMNNYAAALNQRRNAWRAWGEDLVDNNRGRCEDAIINYNEALNLSNNLRKSYKKIEEEMVKLEIGCGIEIGYGQEKPIKPSE